jgi:hypothetical protein
MQIGDHIIHRGRLVRLLGHDPMSVPDRLAQVQALETGERYDVPYEELEELPEPRQGFGPRP